MSLPGTRRRVPGAGYPAQVYLAQYNKIGAGRQHTPSLMSGLMWVRPPQPSSPNWACAGLNFKCRKVAVLVSVALQPCQHAQVRCSSVEPPPPPFPPPRQCDSSHFVIVGLRLQLDLDLASCSLLAHGLSLQEQAHGTGDLERSRAVNVDAFIINV